MLAGSAKRLELPKFEAPSLPRCASSPVPLHYSAHQQEKLELRRRLKHDEFTHLDFHGVGGDVDGLRALLTHKYGGAVPGWRCAIAPDRIGNGAVTYSEFCIALRKIGYGGQIKTLWRTMAQGRLSIHLEDFEPDFAEVLDLCSQSIYDHFDDGTAGAWIALQRDHLGRANYDEFEDFFLRSRDDRDNPGLFPEDAPRVNLRRVFQALDVHGKCSITKDDLQFLDHWGHRRLGLPSVEDTR